MAVPIEPTSVRGGPRPATDTLLDLHEAIGREAGPLLARYGRSFVLGEMLFREGEPATTAYILHEGRVRLLKRVRMVERSLAVLRAGDVFGESALIDGVLRTTTAVALSDGVALAVDRPALRAIVEGFPTVAERVVTQLVQRLRDAEDQIEILMLDDAQSKVIAALLKMAGPGGAAVELAVSPVELATRVGLDVDAVKRAVQRLREQQYLRISGERVEILDLEAMRRLYALLGSKEELRTKRG